MVQRPSPNPKDVYIPFRNRIETAHFPGDLVHDGVRTVRVKVPQARHNPKSPAAPRPDSGQFAENRFYHASTRIPRNAQDINACAGSLTELHALNGAGRSKISALRKYIDNFGDIAKENKSTELLKEVVSQREQLKKAMDDFKKANIKSMLTIERNMKEELLKSNSEESNLRQRQKRDKEHLVKVTSSVTDQLMSISRLLADTTKRSAETLDTLVISSDNVTGTQEELKVTSGFISQSGKLLNKFGRREFTDKILMFVAFTFFIACVLYIVQKRMF